MIQINITDIKNESPEVIRRLAAYLIGEAEAFENANVKYDEAMTASLTRKSDLDNRIHDYVETSSAKDSYEQTRVEPVLFTYETPCVIEEVAAEPLKAGIDIDSQGYPWDGRIHSGSRVKLSDGSWKLKRGAELVEVERIRSEFDQAIDAPPPVNFTDVLANIPLPVSPIPVPPLPLAVVSEVPLPPLPVTIEHVQVDIKPVTFTQLMQAVTKAFAAKELTREKIQEVCQQVGIPSLPMLVQRTDKIPEVVALLGVAV